MSTIQVQVKTIQGKIYKIDVKPDETIQSFRSLVSAQIGSSANSILLVYNSEKIQNEKKLSDYGIANNAIVFTAIKLHGGF